MGTLSDSQLLYDMIGYAAILINLRSMYANNETSLRRFSIVANAVFIIYGFLIAAPPVYIGCSIAVGLHAYRLYHLKSSIA